MADPRVVITGLGPVSAIGVGRDAFSDALRRSESGIGDITLFEPWLDGPQLAAEVRDFQVTDYLQSAKGYLDRSSEFLLAGMALAREDAGLDSCDITTAGICLGSAFGSTETMSLFFEGFLDKGPRFAKPFLFPHTYSNTAISLAAIEWGLHGPHLAFAAGHTSAATAIAAAVDQIRLGRTDVVFAGGYDAFSEFVYATYASLGRLSVSDDDPARTNGPFGKGRDGVILGEGAGIIALENAEHAAARGARVYAEIIDTGHAADSTVDRHDGNGNAIRETMPATSQQEWALVSAAANGSPFLDRNEAQAITALRSSREAHVTVSALKALTGETLGASGGLQTIAIALAMTGDVDAQPVEPGNIDPSLGLHSGPNDAMQGAPHVGWVNAIDPGGAIVSLLLRAAERE